MNLSLNLSQKLKLMNLSQNLSRKLMSQTQEQLFQY